MSGAGCRPWRSSRIGAGYTEYAGALAFTAYDGSQSLDLTGSGWRGYNGVAQTVATTPGATFELTFHVGNQSSNFGFYGLPSAVEVLIDGASAGVFANADDSPADVNWKAFSLTFAAASASTTVAFMNATGSADNMAGLDGVALTEVPEPA